MWFFIESTIGCIIMLVCYWYMSDIIFQKKSSKNFISFLMLMILAAIATALNMLGSEVDIIIRSIIVFIIMVLFNKNKYKERVSNTVLKTSIVYINVYLADIILTILIVLIDNLSNIDIFSIIQYSLIANSIVAIIMIIMITLLSKVYLKLLSKIQNNNLTLSISTVIIMIIIALLISKFPSENIKITIELITLVSLIIMFCLIGIYMIKQKSEIDEVTDQYTKLAAYSKNNEGLLEEYRINLHNTKNQLIMIDSMIPKKYKEIHEYMDQLMEKNKRNKYYWLTELKYVPTPELKGFMNYKIIEMIENKIKLEINISREINRNIMEKYKVKEKEELYSIIGILLDNANEAAKESKEKRVSIQMFMEKDDLKLIVANTYKGKIDLMKIDEYGYSSKGVNRGTGLHIVKEIINRNKLFEKESSFLDNYFVQTITIKSEKTKKKEF